MKARLVNAVLPFALLCGSVAAHAQGIRTFGSAASDATNELSVTVLTADGHPVADARVEAREIGTRNAAGYAYTNNSGVAELSVPNGLYDVVATKNIAEANERLEVRNGDTAARLRMPTDPDSAIGGSSTVSVAQFKVPGKARNEFKKAQECLSKKKFDEMQQHLAKALDIYPTYSEALTLRAILEMDELKTDAALADLDAAIKADGSNSMAYFALGAAYNSLSRFDDAIRSLERGLTTAPTSWQGYFELGKAHIGKADYPAALRSLDKAQAYNQHNYPLIHLVKAHALLSLKEYPDAMTELQAYLEKSPDGPNSPDARAMLDQVKGYMAKK